MGSLQVSTIEPPFGPGSELSYHIEEFETRDLKWAPDGKGIVLLDKDVFCCAFEVEEDEIAS